MTPEGQILRAVLGYLAAKHIFALRMNSGSTLAAHNGKTRRINYGVPGCADLLAFPKDVERIHGSDILEIDRHMFPGFVDVHSVRPLWIECKAAKGRQSEPQKSFQEQVEREGHRYIICRSIEDLEAALK